MHSPSCQQLFAATTLCLYVRVCVSVSVYPCPCVRVRVLVSVYPYPCVCVPVSVCPCPHVRVSVSVWPCSCGRARVSVCHVCLRNVLDMQLIAAMGPPGGGERTQIPTETHSYTNTETHRHKQSREHAWTHAQPRIGSALSLCRAHMLIQG